MSDVDPGRPPDSPRQPAAGGGDVSMTVPMAHESGGASLMQSVTTLDRSIKERRDTDETLINWWLYIFIAGPFTFGIYGIYLFFKRINRIDSFSRRKHAYYRSLLEWTERYAVEDGKADEIHHELVDLRGEVERAYADRLRPINAALSLALSLVTLGFYGLFVLYRMNRYWWDAQVLEQDFDDKLSQIWQTAGLMRYPLSFTADQSAKRSYASYLILSVVTFGIWGLVWDYKIHTDPDRIYAGFHVVEDTVLQVVRAH